MALIVTFPFALIFVMMSKVQTPVQNATTSVKSVSERFEASLERLSLFHAGDRRRTFPHILASPIHYEPNYAYPLLVWLHDAEKSESELFDVAPKISARNYVAVAPRGFVRMKKRVVRRHTHGRLVEEKCWMEPCYDWQDSEETVSEAENLVFDSIEQAVNKFNINTRRIFLLGRGAGATMALRVALRNPLEFAGVVSIDPTASMLDDLPLRRWRSIRDLPVLMTTGSAHSQTVPQITSKQLRLFHTAGMTVSIRQYNDNGCERSQKDVRMDKILLDVNRWIMDRALNQNMPTIEMFQRRIVTESEKSF